MNKTNAKLIRILIFTFLLRIFLFTQSPPSFNWDEQAIAYDAYSISQTGKDQHGFTPITTLKSFGDFKNPFYLYTLVPLFFLFGKHDFLIRLPSAFFGTLSVAIFFFLLKEFINEKNIKSKNKNALLGTTLFAINPLMVHCSRIAFEANILVFFFQLSTLFFLKAQKRIKFLPFAILSSCLMPYIYHSGKIFAPLLILIFIPSIVLKHKKKNEFQKNIIISAIILFLLFIPFLFQGAISSTAFRLEGVISLDDNTLNQSMPIQSSNNNLFERILFNHRLNTLKKFLSKYFSHFTADYLFLFGDSNLRHTPIITGNFYLFEIFLLILGLINIKKLKKIKYFLIILLISPLPSAITVFSPHSLRSSTLIPFLLILITIGVNKLLNYTKVALPILLFSYIFFFTQFYYFLIFKYPLQTSHLWQYGYKTAFQQIKPIYKNYENVYIDNSNNQSYIYALYYLNIDPAFFQKEGKILIDSSGKFWFTKADYKNLKFINPEQEENISKYYNSKNSLFLMTKNTYIKNKGSNLNLLSTINSPKNEDIFYILENN